MNPHSFAVFLLWCAAAHYILLVLSFALFATRRDALYRLHTRWLSTPRRYYDAVAFGCLAFYKLVIWLFFLVPGLVLLMFR